MNTRLLRIGEVAKQAGVSPDTLRYYERIGLLFGIGRTDSGYRLYSESVLEQISLVRNALRFGFSLKQVADFLRARQAGHAPCHAVRAAGEEILSRVNEQIRELHQARSEIRRTLRDWDRRLQKIDGEPARLLQSLQSNPIRKISMPAKNRLRGYLRSS